MSCNCKNNNCNNSCGCREVITKRGEKGEQGVVGPPGPTGPAGINAYEEIVNPIDLGVADPNWVGPLDWFIPQAYETISFTNTSGTTKDFIVHVGYGSGTNAIAPGEYGKSDVDCGIFLSTDLVNPLYDIAAKVQINDGDSPTLYQVNQNPSFFKKVTLLDGQGVAVQFRCKDVAVGHLRKAQLFVREL